MIIRLTILSLSFVLGLTTAAPCAEPTVPFNGWLNTPGLVEGKITTHGKETATSTAPPMGYLDYLPKGYDPNGTARWPVVFYLAGSGEMYNGALGYGTANASYLSQLTTKMQVHGPLYQVTTNKWDFPCIVIAPQTTTTARWNNANTLHQMVTYALANYRCDPERLYMTGLCEGGSGTLRYAVAKPTTLAAIVPIISIHNPSAATATYLGDAAQLGNLPMWCVHAFGDQSFHRRSSIAWIDEVTAAATGRPSNVMATYPSYNNPNYHYAVDVGSDGKPLAWNGAKWTFSNALVTTGSKDIYIDKTLFSIQTTQLSGTDAKPFTQVKIGQLPTKGKKTETRKIYVTAGATANVLPAKITLTQPYSEALAGGQQVEIQLPTGYDATAHQDPITGAWVWRRGQPVGPGLRLFSMYWFESHAGAWKNHWNSGPAWDWLFRQNRTLAPAGNG